MPITAQANSTLTNRRRLARLATIANQHGALGDRVSTYVETNLRKFFRTFEAGVLTRLRSFIDSGGRRLFQGDPLQDSTFLAAKIFNPDDYRLAFVQAIRPALQRAAYAGVGFEREWIHSARGSQSVASWGISTHNDFLNSDFLNITVIQTKYIPGNFLEKDFTLTTQQVPSIDVPVNSGLASSIDSWLKYRPVGIWTKVDQTTQNKLRDIGYRALVEGDTLEEMADRFQAELPSYSRYAAKRIARTETTGAMNFGQHLERTELGIEHKEWVSTLDARTRGVKAKDRFDHISMHGTVALNGTLFTVSGELMLYPGDISQGASAGNVIHCRCCAVAAFPPGGVIPPKPKIKLSAEDRNGKSNGKKGTRKKVAKPKKTKKTTKKTAKKISVPAPRPSPVKPLTKEQQETQAAIKAAQDWASSDAAKNEMGLTIKAMNLAKRDADAVLQSVLSIPEKLKEANRKKTELQLAFKNSQQEYIEKWRSGNAAQKRKLEKRYTLEQELHDARAKAADAEIELYTTRLADTVAGMVSHGIKDEDKLRIVFNIVSQKITAEAKRTADEAVAFLEKATHRSVAEDATGSRRTFIDLLRTNKIYDGDREYYTRHNRTVWINENTNVHTAVHEIGHHLEYESDQQLVRGFLLKRTKGEVAQPLLKRFPIPAGTDPKEWYSHTEISWEDEFAKAFGGSLSNGTYVAKFYSQGSTEIISMGIEQLYKNPVAFAQGDPEYFQFIVSFLRGDLQKAAKSIAAANP